LESGPADRNWCDRVQSNVEKGMNGRNYRDLIAWQKSMDLVEGVYRESRQFPREELYGLTSQIRRAVVSVACNIAEGQGRQANREFCISCRSPTVPCGKSKPNC